MDPSFVPSFLPIAAAMEGVSPEGYVNGTVLDRMNLFGVHDMAVQLVAVWKNRFEWIQKPTPIPANRMAPEIEVSSVPKV